MVPAIDKKSVYIFGGTHTDNYWLNSINSWKLWDYHHEQDFAENDKNQSKIKTFEYPNGDVYIGEMENCLRVGMGRCTYENGNSYEGKWINDMFHGQGAMEWSNGSKYEGEWFEDNRHGAGKMAYAEKANTSDKAEVIVILNAHV